MSERDLMPAKATSPAEQSEGIVVSFGAEWKEGLYRRDFSVVIRKRIPKDDSFKWLYFHINSPESAICGRAEISSIFTATVSEAIALSKKINLPPPEIVSYLGGSDTVGCYKIKNIQLGSRPVAASELAQRMVYHPPQSFFILSRRAMALIDELADFRAEIGKSLNPRK